MQKQAERFGARVQFGVLEAADLSKRPFALTIDGEKVETQTLIIATGAGHRHLGLESEHKLENKGVTYCATCDGALPMYRKHPLEGRSDVPDAVWFSGVFDSSPRLVARFQNHE
jgi:thioredoxin reductase (NADPH)